MLAMGKKEKALFLCSTNSCRSQMAEGILRMIGKDEFEAFSAGAVATSIHPLATKVMVELGLDMSDQKSKSVAEFRGQEFDYVVTLCGENAKSACPVFVGKIKHHLHWDFLDPAEAQGSEEGRLKVFRKVRDQTKAKIELLVRESKESSND
jgi:arsenate reductase